MQRTLLLIPHEIASIPVFGFGWVLGLLVVALLGRLAWASHQHRLHGGASGAPSVGQVVRNEGGLWAAAAVVVAFLMPNAEIGNLAGEPVGLAVRWYGVMLVIAIASAVVLAAYRVERYGMNPEHVYAFTPWLLGFGIAGARLFYVIQYRDEFFADSLGQTIRNMMAFTEGGLVVYGSFIAGFITYLVFTKRNKIPMLRFADAIIPCVFLGVFFGRIGCLMNGCCYGGRCEDGWAAIQFPPLTAIYQNQLSSGELLGMNVDPKTGKIRSVVGGSFAEKLGIQDGEVIEMAQFDDRYFAELPNDAPAEEAQPGWFMKVSGKVYALSPQDLPDKSLPVRAAQPISSACALGLCLFLLIASRYIQKEGALLAIGFGCYAMIRFGLEIVRVDESGQFNTTLTISQWVSVVVFSLSLLTLVWLYLPRRSETPNAS